MINKITLILLSVVMLLLSSCVATSVGVVGAISAINQDRRSVGTVVDDETLDLFLENWINDNPIAADGRVDFSVYNRNVLMTGEVPNEQVKNAIEQAMLKQREDIVRVINELRVAPNRSFAQRLNDIKTKLHIELLFYNQEVFHPSHVLVVVNNNTAYLLGSVTEREARSATKQATQAAGIKRIVKYFNYLTKPPKAEIERAKKRELELQQQQERMRKIEELEQQKQKIQDEINKIQ